MQRMDRDCPQGATYYTWREGDTLVGVAQQNGVSSAAIRQANAGLPLETVSPGTRICLPQQSPVCPSGRLYTVRRGDTLADIARVNLVSVGDLIDQNPYVDPDDLQIGQVLCLPEPRPVPGPGAQGSACPAGYTQTSVRYGDTLVDILTRYDMSYAVFREANPTLSANTLAPGQRLCVPPVGQRGGCGRGRSYLIQDGENLSRAASANQTSATVLLLRNPN